MWMSVSADGRGSSEGKQAAVIVNPVKADVGRLRSAVAVEEALRGWKPSRWYETTKEDAGQEATKAALEHEPAVLIIAGGDGTVRAVAGVAMSSGAPLALVPTGAGNLLARNLGLMTGLTESVRTAFTGSDRLIDVGVAEIRPRSGPATTHAFLVMAGIGLDASMATGTSSALKRRIGWLAYTDPIGKSIVGNEQFHMRYRVDDGNERSTWAHTVIVGNCGTLTAGLLLLPDASVDDALLDVVLLRPRGFWDWLRVGSRLSIGGLLHRFKTGMALLQAAPRLRALQYVQARRLEAHFDAPQEVELDGDPFGEVVAVTVTVLPRALALRTPRGVTERSTRSDRSRRTRSATGSAIKERNEARS